MRTTTIFGRDFASHTAANAYKPRRVFLGYIVAVTSPLRTRFAAQNGFHRGERSSDVPYIWPAIGSIADAHSTPSCLDSADAHFRGVSRQSLLYVLVIDGSALVDVVVVVVGRIKAQRKVQLGILALTSTCLGPVAILLCYFNLRSSLVLSAPMARKVVDSESTMHLSHRSAGCSDGSAEFCRPRDSTVRVVGG